MEEISGGYSWDTSSFLATAQSLVLNGAEAIGSAILGGVVAGGWGAFAAGGKAGDGGGILGFGLIGELVGVIFGAIGGGLTGAVAAASAGWDTTLSLVIQSFQAALDGTFTPWTPRNGL